MTWPPRADQVTGESGAMRRVLVVEDQVVMREAVTRVLGAAHLTTVVGVFGTVRATLDALRKGLEAEVALIDLGLPDGSGVDLIRAIRASQPAMIVVAFTALDDGETVFQALRAGARGYLLKSTGPTRLLNALDEALAGGAPMSPSVARRVVEAFQQDGQDLEDEVQLSKERASVARLTSREREVLLFVAKGMSYPEIARLLGVALGTVQGYVREVYAKLEVTSKAEAAVIATRLGLL